ncbi:hypothetical protein [Sorangium sp. So ce1097]|uniref:hypothetical protein n=1 Tax=Sorangium sp. So ce1097 TaxID=3133330 RepID=UPI003F6441D2
MARTAPVPNIPAIPGMNPGVFVMSGGAGGGGQGGRRAMAAAADRADAVAMAGAAPAAGAATPAAGAGAACRPTQATEGRPLAARPAGEPAEFGPGNRIERVGGREVATDAAGRVTAIVEGEAGHRLTTREELDGSSRGLIGYIGV